MFRLIGRIFTTVWPMEACQRWAALRVYGMMLNVRSFSQIFRAGRPAGFSPSRTVQLRLDVRSDSPFGGIIDLVLSLLRVSQLPIGMQETAAFPPKR